MNIWYAAVIPYGGDDFDQLLIYADRMIQLEPHFFGGPQFKGLALLDLGKDKSAIPIVEKGNCLLPNLNSCVPLIIAYKVTGNRKKLLEILKMMQGLKSPGIEGNYYFGFVHVALGQYDQAYEYFERALSENEGILPVLKSHLRYLRAKEFLELPRSQLLRK